MFVDQGNSATAKGGGNSNRTPVHVNIVNCSYSDRATVANVTSPNSLALVLCELLVFLAKQAIRSGVMPP